MPNFLAGSASPYLLQHQHNPVEWHPWGDAALDRAAVEDKPLLISIGYSSCHWCHVMERETFTDEAIAAVMNAHFVCIKVDREERPDVDHVFMTAVQLMNGNGGWPLNVFALPDGRPFYGGTYFRPGPWLSLLENIAAVYRDNRRLVLQQAEQLAEGIQRNELFAVAPGPEASGETLADSMAQALRRQWDPVHGGTRGAPKFPLPVVWSFLLKHAWLRQDASGLAHLGLTLRSMARGGLFDHVGGGFARYSVDEAWHVPHFEKMLYDNAQLVSLYSVAAALTGEAALLIPALRSLEFLQRELRQAGGAYSGSLDADSEGEEGRYYVWTREELKEVLGQDFETFSTAYGIGQHSLWEGGRHVLRSLSDPDQGMLLLLERLRVARSLRPAPACDDKVICSWNALMLSALCHAGRASGRDGLLEEARGLARFLVDRMRLPGGRLSHVWKEGKAYQEAFLEDYALLAAALVDLHQATLEEPWLLQALHLAEEALGRFGGPGSDLLWFAPADSRALLSRTLETHDTVMPSSNAVMAGVLLKLGLLLERHDLSDRAARMTAAMHPAMKQWPTGHLGWGLVLLDLSVPLGTLFITGPQAAAWGEKVKALNPPFLMVAIDSGGSMIPHLQSRRVPGNTQAFLCTAYSCSPPLHHPEEVIRRITASPKDQDQA
ncbi:MAG TPA: thioredoxin domain-containing protein [Bacteroidales bacterium]|nr:thioredoxin domain-containing protein [Bacteroidales bacterium]HRZ75730.1 thioredoxin domain-containing protein [Bacteroidales bacterium]